MRGYSRGVHVCKIRIVGKPEGRRRWVGLETAVGKFCWYNGVLGDAGIDDRRSLTNLPKWEKIGEEIRIVLDCDKSVFKLWKGGAFVARWSLEPKKSYFLRFQVELIK